MTEKQVGASIISQDGEGTHLVCDDLGNNLHYTLAEVDCEGAVVVKEGKYQRLSFSHHPDLIQVHRGTNDNLPVRVSGKQLPVRVGSHSVTIRVTRTGEIMLNGNFPGLLNDERERIRYPRTRS